MSPRAPRLLFALFVVLAVVEAACATGIALSWVLFGHLTISSAMGLGNSVIYAALCAALAVGISRPDPGQKAPRGGSIVCTLPGGDRVAVAWDTTTPAPGPDGDAGGAA